MKLISTLPLLAFAMASQVSARNCTSADLAGAYNEFRLTGGLGTYSPGTNQVVSYDHPKDSAISGLTGIDIVKSGEECELDTDSVSTPIVISGVPATFNDDDIGDKAGAIYLRLPVVLPAGEYKYRITLTTGSADTCYLHSECFTSDGLEVVDSCEAGESRCLDAVNFVECVVDTAEPTSNGTFTSTVQSCGAGTSCIQDGVNALCTAGSTGPVVNPNPVTPDACVVPGSMRCINETAWHQCIGGGDNWAWSTETQLCASGTTCGSYQTDYIICQ